MVPPISKDSSTIIGIPSHLEGSNNTDEFKKYSFILLVKFSNMILSPSLYLLTFSINLSFSLPSPTITNFQSSLVSEKVLNDSISKSNPF